MNKPAFVALNPGSLISSEGVTYKVTNTLDMGNFLCLNVETGQHRVIGIEKIGPVIKAGSEGNKDPTSRDAQDYTDEEWQTAHKRLEIISPLLTLNGRTRQKVEDVAAKNRCSAATIYSWLKVYCESGLLSSLIPATRGMTKGTRRLDEATDTVIDQAITEVYLTDQRLTPKDVHLKVKELCLNARPPLPIPHVNTVRNRINALPTASTLRRRGKKDEARDKYEAILGPFPNADHILSVVQIDHTVADIILVEESTGQTINRPVVTLAIDVYSRMVVGLYISFEKPSSLAAGMCLSMAMLPKTSYLLELGVPGEWPVWGKMGKIHADNAREFRGEMLREATELYNIGLELRPVKKPHYGGHIERLMLTTARQIHKWPGTTFSNTQERKGYDSEKKAALTLREFEANLVDFIVNVYHKNKHAELGMSPLQKWQEDVLGRNDDKPARGVPEVPADPAKLRLDFLPFKERTVQPYGILLDDIYYYHEVLNPWINAMDPELTRYKRKFIVRRDPRNISQLYFFDPEIKLLICTQT
ncbi:transposase [Silvimonas iriomotensis]|uniref:Transposase n=2 Tax=Silvimonas iriomotensis TaxID=449662 RepID=A0ABQ2PBI8_9NEIS|nr:transposase [Silvimonas iriomotensis]